MNAKRMFYIMVSAITLIAVFGILTIDYGNKLLTEKSSQLYSLKLQARVLDEQQLTLAKAKTDVAKYQDLNKIAQTVVPEEKDQALAVREIINASSQAGITISSIIFPASNLGVGQSSLLNSSSVKMAPVIVTAPSQLLRVLGLSGIYTLPITIQSDVSSPINFAQLTKFLQTLEQNRHTAEVSQLTITPSDSSGKQLSFTIVVSVYIKK
jgi:hypothetical protein